MNNKHNTLQSLVQFVKYALVGANNVIIDIMVLNILSYTTGITRGNMLFVFNIIAFCVYSLCGYNLNKKFTFRETTSKKAYFQYASVLFFSMLLNGFMLVLLTAKNPLVTLMPKEPDVVKLNHLWFNLCVLMDSMIIGLLGFLVNKFFVFNRKKTC